MTRKFERRKPCGNCPFRRDAPLAHWHPDEYRMLQDIGRGEGDFGTSRTFGCHKDKHEAPKDREPCVGWLLYQREANVPSLACRILLLNPDALAQFEESEPDGELYDDIDELVEDNIDADRDLNPERYQ